ncbi:MAG: hypothetical protein QOG62_140 [Thermoleophilaceae bacterium]|jgi:hypothetical protein|nr:hypothetical protein [Thermoleophilaceae bacterium]
MSATQSIEVVEHGEDSELRQQPTDQEWWQDSVFLTWHDLKQEIGGIVRIGHEPNHAGGITNLWFGVVTEDGTRFRRNVTSPLTDADRLPDGGFGILDGRYQWTYDGHIHFRVEDDECSLDLTVEDFYPRTDFFPTGAGTLLDDFASSHYETSGRVTGTVQLDGRDYVIDGLCHRDHSWGLRLWDTLLNHRWCPGTFGPDLSFGAIAWHGRDGTIRQYGYVVREGRVVHADSVDILVQMEADATTFRAGSCTWQLPGEEAFTLNFRPIDAVVFEHHGVASVESVAVAELDGRQGVSDLAVSTNPRAGSGPVTAALRAAHVDGLTKREINI